MAKTASDFKLQFLARVKEARLGTGLSQAKFSKLLNVYQGKYKHYETRIYLPRDLIERFCLATGVNQTWLLTGEGPKLAAPRLVRGNEGATGEAPPKRRRSR